MTPQFRNCKVHGMTKRNEVLRLPGMETREMRLQETREMRLQETREMRLLETREMRLLETREMKLPEQSQCRVNDTVTDIRTCMLSVLFLSVFLYLKVLYSNP